MDEITIEARVFSLSYRSEKYTMIFSPINSSNAILFEQLQIDSFVACVYEANNKWYFSKIVERSTEDLEVKVHFMKPPGEDYTERECRFSKKKTMLLMLQLKTSCH